MQLTDSGQYQPHKLVYCNVLNVHLESHSSHECKAQTAGKGKPLFKVCNAAIVA